MKLSTHQVKPISKAHKADTQMPTLQKSLPCANASGTHSTSLDTYIHFATPRRRANIQQAICCYAGRRLFSQLHIAISPYPSDGILFSICCYLHHQFSIGCGSGLDIINSSTAAIRTVAYNSIDIIMLCKLTLLLAFTSIVTSIEGQTRTSEVLKLKDEQHYSERDIFFIGKTPSLIQELCFDKRYTIDEEYCLILKLIILDTSKAKQLETIDLTKDTSIVKFSWDIRSVWNWADEKTTVTGSIKILSLTKKSIEVSVDIFIHDDRHDWNYIYKGDRTFERSKKGKSNEWGYTKE